MRAARPAVAVFDSGVDFTHAAFGLGDLGTAVRSSLATLADYRRQLLIGVSRVEGVEASGLREALDNVENALEEFPHSPDRPTLIAAQGFAPTGFAAEEAVRDSAVRFDIIGHGTANAYFSTLRGYHVASLRISQLLANRVDMAALVEASIWLVENKERLGVTHALWPFASDQPQAREFFNKLIGMLNDCGVHVITAGRGIEAGGVYDMEEQWPADLSTTMAVDETRDVTTVTLRQLHDGPEVVCIALAGADRIAVGQIVDLTYATIFGSTAEFDSVGDTAARRAMLNEIDVIVDPTGTLPKNAADVGRLVLCMAANPDSREPMRVTRIGTSTRTTSTRSMPPLTQGATGRLAPIPTTRNLWAPTFGVSFSVDAGLPEYRG